MSFGFRARSFESIVSLIVRAVARFGTRAPSLGLGGWDQMLDLALAARLGIEGQGGVLVIDVHPGGAAERGGLEPLDVVVRARGRRVQSLDDLARAISSPFGQRSPLRLAAIRGKRLVDFELELELGWSEDEEAGTKR